MPRKPACIVLGCTPTLPLHSLTMIAGKRQMWLKNLGRMDLLNSEMTGLKICSAHFTVDQYNYPGSKKLLRHAIPTPIYTEETSDEEFSETSKELANETIEALPTEASEVTINSPYEVVSGRTFLPLEIPDSSASLSIQTTTKPEASPLRDVQTYSKQCSSEEENIEAQIQNTIRRLALERCQVKRSDTKKVEKGSMTTSERNTPNALQVRTEYPTISSSISENAEMSDEYNSIEILEDSMSISEINTSNELETEYSTISSSVSEMPEENNTTENSDYNFCLLLYKKLKNVTNKNKKKELRKKIMHFLIEMESDSDDDKSF